MGSLVVDAKALVEEFKLLRNSFLHVAFGAFLELIVAVTEMAELAPARSWVLEEFSKRESNARRIDMYSKRDDPGI